MFAVNHSPPSTIWVEENTFVDTRIISDSLSAVAGHHVTILFWVLPSVKGTL